MKTKDNVTVQVSHWGESTTNFALLVDPNIIDGKVVGFSRKEWFPKDVCTLERIPAEDPKTDTAKYYLTAPAWLLDKKNVKYENKI